MTTYQSFTLDHAVYMPLHHHHLDRVFPCGVVVSLAKVLAVFTNRCPAKLNPHWSVRICGVGCKLQVLHQGIVIFFPEKLP